MGANTNKEKKMINQNAIKSTPLNYQVNAGQARPTSQGMGQGFNNASQPQMTMDTLVAVLTQLVNLLQSVNSGGQQSQGGMPQQNSAGNQGNNAGINAGINGLLQQQQSPQVTSLDGLLQQQQAQQQSSGQYQNVSDQLNNLFNNQRGPSHTIDTVDQLIREEGSTGLLKLQLDDHIRSDYFQQLPANVQNQLVNDANQLIQQLPPSSGFNNAVIDPSLPLELQQQLQRAEYNMISTMIDAYYQQNAASQGNAGMGGLFNQMQSSMQHQNVWN